MHLRTNINLAAGVVPMAGQVSRPEPARKMVPKKRLTLSDRAVALTPFRVFDHDSYDALPKAGLTRQRAFKRQRCGECDGRHETARLYQWLCAPRFKGRAPASEGTAP